MGQINTQPAEPKPKEPKNNNLSTEVKIAIIGGVVTVVVATITCIGGIAVAGVEPFAKWFIDRTPIPTSSPISPTEFIPSPMPVVEPVATNTSDSTCTSSQNCSVGADWKNNCIAAYNWSIYSSSDAPNLPKDEHGCYAQPILDAFYTNDGGLYIFAQPKALTKSKDYGLFVPLSQNGKISITVDLDKVENAQIWFGIFELPDVNSKGVLLVAPPGDVREQAFALKTMPEDKRIEVSRVFQNPSGRYMLGFELEFGSIIANAEGISMTPIPFTSPNRWLFIGYRAKLDDPANGSADIQVLFTDLKVAQ